MKCPKCGACGVELKLRYGDNGSGPFYCISLSACLRRQLAAEREAHAETKRTLRVCLCIYCGEGIVYHGDADTRSIEQVHAEMKAHDASCPKNPIVARAEKAESDRNDALDQWRIDNGKWSDRCEKAEASMEAMHEVNATAIARQAEAEAQADRLLAMCAERDEEIRGLRIELAGESDTRKSAEADLANAQAAWCDGHEVMSAIGSLPDGFCICPSDRREDREHCGECADARRWLLSPNPGQPLLDRIAELEAIVAKLPKTADGVAITEGMELHSADAPNLRFTARLTIAQEVEGMSPDASYAPLLELYSTSAAAEAAKGAAVKLCPVCEVWYVVVTAIDLCPYCGQVAAAEGGEK